MSETSYDAGAIQALPLTKKLVTMSDRFRYFPVPGGGFYDPYAYGYDGPETDPGTFLETYTFDGYDEYLSGLSADEQASELAYWNSYGLFPESSPEDKMFVMFSDKQDLVCSVREQMDACVQAFGQSTVDSGLQDLITEIDRVFDPTQPDFVVEKLNSTLWNSTCKPHVNSPWGEQPPEWLKESFLEKFMAGIKYQWLVWKHTKYFNGSHRFSSFLSWMGIHDPILKLHYLQYTSGLNERSIPRAKGTSSPRGESGHTGG